MLKHLVTCAYCGGAMHHDSRSAGRTYLVCEAGQRGSGCKYRRISYAECEQVLLDDCHKLKPEQVLVSQDEQSKLCQSLRQRLQGIDGELADCQKQIKNFTDQIGRTDKPTQRDRYQASIDELESRQVDLEKQKVVDEGELRNAEQGLQSFKQWKTNLESLKRALAKKDDAELRIRLNSHLKEFIDKIEVFSDGYPFASKEDDDGGDTFADYLRDVFTDNNFEPATNTKQFKAFLRHVMQRRLSKAARFLQVHFKSGRKVDLVPPGSVATRKNVERDGSHGIAWDQPDLDQLWQQFTTKTVKTKKSVE